MSALLDAMPEIYDLVAQDLIALDTKKTGRQGLSVESIVRCGILKQTHQITYDELAFFLEDSQSYQAFARITGCPPKKSSLQETISLLSADTWESINQLLLKQALEQKIENGKLVRIDSTVTETNIHEPSDSSLLWDCVRVMTRLLDAAQTLASTQDIKYSGHQRRAKKRAHQIIGDNAKKRKGHYKDLLKVTKQVLNYLQSAQENVPLYAGFFHECERWHGEVEELIPLVLKVINQTERRVIHGEKVPASEKIFSLFETHTDIIIKGSRKIEYGHKLNLTTGKSGLILDLVVESGNPGDSSQLMPMLERQVEIYGKPPRQAAADGGYASKENIEKAKKLGVNDIAFHKKKGILVSDMVKSDWVYRKLKNFRAGIESQISCLKRAYGLTRCTWKGLERFKAFVWSGAFAYNLALLSKRLATIT